MFSFLKTRKSVFLWIYWGMLAIAIMVVLIYQAFTFVHNLPPVVRDTKVVFIEPKSTVRDIAQRLGNAQVLQSPWKFRLLARVTGKHRMLKPGEYRFDVPSPPLKILNTLAEGKVLLHKTTFPEGVTLKDIVEILAWYKLVDRQEFESALADKSLLKKFQIPAPGFEGFLFPDTYFFSKIDGSKKIIETMVARFHKAITKENRRKAKDYDFNLLQWVTLASIIEKESSVPKEHPIISSVFHNRLKKKMRLQSDPTVIYGLEKFDGNLTKKHLKTDSPYNTYTRFGMPPGPIANPGMSALHAAVNPAQTDYYYFVANNQGTHVFSRTYREHRKAVIKYQIRSRRSARLARTRNKK